MLPHWTENDIDVDGIKIHYTRTGDGNKPALVLAHGFSDSGQCWLPVTQSLEKEYDVILPDARGHGKSARVQPGEVLDAAADLAGLIRNLGLQKPIVGGHSMGANTSSVMGAQYPGLASALILEDPPWFMPQSTEDETKGGSTPRLNPFHDWLSSLKDKTKQEIIAKGRANDPNWPEVEWEPWAESKIQFDMNFLQTERGSIRNWQETVAGIECPILLITAETGKGALVSPEAAQIAVSLNNRIQVAAIPNAGHNIRRDNFEAYLAVLKGYLAAVST